MKEKIKITPEELGKVLFMFIYKVAYDQLNDKEILKNWGVGEKDKSYLIIETITALFFLTIVKVEDSLDNENLEKKVFDSMHEAYYKGMDLDEEKSKEMKSYFLKRYTEYRDAMKEKRGPNWLWPVTHHILNNLKQEETKDAFVMVDLTAFLTSVIEQIPNLINKYEIVKEKNNL